MEWIKRLEYCLSLYQTHRDVLEIMHARKSSQSIRFSGLNGIASIPPGHKSAEQSLDIGKSI
jgi:hypothetical protein